MIWKTLLLLKRQAARRKLEFGWRLGRGGRLPGKGVSLGVGGSGGGRLDVEEVIRQLHLLSEEDRGGAFVFLLCRVKRICLGFRMRIRVEQPIVLLP